jgi:predicted membrane-bound dolichyl-phosphate-mannose-protein mannosyltransferase
MKKKLFILLGIIFLAHFLFRVYEYRTAYLTPYDAEYWKQKYENSQWSTKPACEDLDPHVNPYTCVWDDAWYASNKDNPAANDLKRNTIGDDGVYTYAGWAYIHGHDPTTLNAEIPPFGKYLIGISEVVFKNQNIFALASGIFALIAFYLLNTVILKNKFFAFLPVYFLSLEPLFYTSLRTTLLDTLYFGLLCMTFYFILKKHFIRSAIFLGLTAATKSTAATFPLVIGVVFLYLLITKQFGAIKKYCISLPVAILTFMATYTYYFLLGHSLTEFLGVQKWIINFYTSGAKGSLTAPWEILFTGEYNNWIGTQSSVSEWHILWAILPLICAFAILVIAKKYKNTPISLIALWTVTYLLFLSFVPVWARYFLLVLPFMYTLTIWSVHYLYVKSKP